MQIDPRFVFLGNAVGVAAHIRRPEDRIVWVKGQSSLPVTGGYSKSAADCRDCSGIVTFDSASTSASADFVDRDRAIARTFGEQNDQPIETLTHINATVTNVAMLTRVTAERVEMNLTSHHGGTDDEPHISPKGSAIAGLRIDGHLLNIELDTGLFDRLGSKAGFCDAYAEDEDFREDFAAQLFRGNREEAQGNQGADDNDDDSEVPEFHGYIVCTLVKKISWADKPHPNAQIQLNRIYLPDYGRIFVAELLIGEGSKRLTMLRFEFGSPVGGSGAIGDGQTNGTKLP